MTTMEELVKRVQRLEDIEAIKKFKMRYSAALDDNYNAEIIASMFTEDGVWDRGEVLGVYKGRQAIYEHFKEMSLPFCVHYFVSPDIVVDGDKAHARWYLWEATTRPDNTPRLLSGWQDDDYIKVDGQWLQSYMKFKILFYTPYADGWVKTRIGI